MIAIGGAAAPEKVPEPCLCQRTPRRGLPRHRHAPRHAVLVRMRAMRRPRNLRNSATDGVSPRRRITATLAHAALPAREGSYEPGMGDYLAWCEKAAPTDAPTVLPVEDAPLPAPSATQASSMRKKA